MNTLYVLTAVQTKAATVQPIPAAPLSLPIEQYAGEWSSPPRQAIATAVSVQVTAVFPPGGSVTVPVVPFTMALQASYDQGLNWHAIARGDWPGGPVGTQVLALAVAAPKGEPLLCRAVLSVPFTGLDVGLGLTFFDVSGKPLGGN